MILAGLFLLALSPTDEADAANLAYVQCLFATSRAASAARLSVDAFEQKLAGSCRSEQRALKRLEPANLHGLDEAARQQVVETYRRALELEPELRKFEEMCRAHPGGCRE